MENVTEYQDKSDPKVRVAEIIAGILISIENG